jgi:hypothetical protein
MTTSDLALYLFVGFIVLLNIVLWTSFRRKGTSQFFDMWRKAGTSYKGPWEKEDRNLQELSARVQQLRQGNPDEKTKKELNGSSS